MIYDVSEAQFEVVYDALAFGQACMMSTTLFLFFRLGAVHEQFKTPVMIAGLVTFIASFYYMRIFESWDNAYEYSLTEGNGDGSYNTGELVPTGRPFNDSLRYMDWLLTVPLLLMEIVLVMKLEKGVAVKKSTTLGVSAALMIILGYPGELVMDSDNLDKRWATWGLAMIPFIYIVYELIFGLKGALESETDERIRNKIWWATRVTVVSWLTYPLVYIIPMLGAEGATAVVGVQLGYCFSDIISKCGVGLLIFQITSAKSQQAINDATPLMKAQGVVDA